MNKTAKFIQDQLTIVDKQLSEVPFVLNKIQDQFVNEDIVEKSVVLKARQQGFSSVILAMFTKDFLLKDNSVNVVVADIADNAKDLLSRVKHYLKSFGDKQGFDVEKEVLKYNSKYELYNKVNNARYIIGTAESREFGRSKTITNLHLSEFAFYPDAEKLLAGALQAVIPGGRVIIETTANGFNYFKDFWDRSELGHTGFKPLFYPASHFYSEQVLDQKRMELGRMFTQEYPETPIEAFLTSGENYFDKDALQNYLKAVEHVAPLS